MTTSTSFLPWRIWFWPAAVMVLVSDQLSKWWLFALPRNAEMPSWIHRDYNPGIAWSGFRDHPSLVALSTLVLLPILSWVWWRWYRPLGRVENLAFGLVLGGAIGNAIDRLALVPLGLADGVRDFISVDLHPLGIAYVWPTFNIADAGISGGFILLVLAGFRPQRSVAAERPGAV